MKLNGMFFYTCICTGTKCDSRKDCGAEMSCTAMESFGNKIKNCVPKLNEGAICSFSPISAVDDDDDDEKTTNPCAEQLKCAAVG